MKRYLLNISYIGTQFRGLQKTIIKAQESPPDTRTVQGSLEIALGKLNPINPIEVQLSSRTDSGVHALDSSVHVDLEKPSGTWYSSIGVTRIVNRELARRGLAIRVIKTIHVPDTFHCRFSAKARTYLYRLAVSKESVISNDSQRFQNFTSFIPIEESERCFFIQNSNFEIDKLKEAAKLFVGRHDFRTFMKSSKNNEKQAKAMFTVRTIDDIKVSSGNPVTNSFDYNRSSQLYNYWDITITGKSFLHNQVRRIVGTLVAAASGMISIKDVYEMLTIPSKNSWHPRALVLPGFGLYLCKVHYNEDDFLFKDQSKSENDESTEGTTE